jgi:hypothetical protein
MISMSAGILFACDGDRDNLIVGHEGFAFRRINGQVHTAPVWFSGQERGEAPISPNLITEGQFSDTER